jgi:hypothetical protein
MRFSKAYSFNSASVATSHAGLQKTDQSRQDVGSKQWGQALQTLLGRPPFGKLRSSHLPGPVHYLFIL